MHYIQLGELQRAEKCLRASVKDSRTNKDYVILRKSQVELGQTLRLQSKYKQAVRILKGAVETHNTQLPEDRLYLEYLNNQLAKAYSGNNQFREAQILYSGNIDYVNKINKPNGILAGSIYLDYGEMFITQGNLTQAKTYLSKAEPIIVQTNSEKEITAHLWNALGILYSKLANHQKALNYFKKSLSVREKYFAQKKYTLAQVKNNIGLSYESLGDCRTALFHFKESEQIYTTLYGKNNPDVMSIKSNKGICYISMSDYQAAKEELKSALQLTSKYLPKYHLITAKIHANLAVVYSNLSQAGLSCIHKESAYDIFSKVLGPDHVDTRAIHKEMVRCRLD